MNQVIKYTIEFKSSTIYTEYEFLPLENKAWNKPIKIIQETGKICISIQRNLYKRENRADRVSLGEKQN